MLYVRVELPPPPPTIVGTQMFQCQLLQDFPFFGELSRRLLESQLTIYSRVSFLTLSLCLSLTERISLVMPNTVPGLKGKSRLVELISVYIVAVTRASAYVWLEALSPASPPSVLSSFPTHGHAVSAWLLLLTGSLLSHNTAHPILELQLCNFPARTQVDLRQVKDYRDLLQRRKGVEQGTWEHEERGH